MYNRFLINLLLRWILLLSWIVNLLLLHNRVLINLLLRWIGNLNLLQLVDQQAIYSGGQNDLSLVYLHGYCSKWCCCCGFSFGCCCWSCCCPCCIFCCCCSLFVVIHFVYTFASVSIEAVVAVNYVVGAAVFVVSAVSTGAAGSAVAGAAVID
ncbi:hypothetical protein Ancab_040136 [Ancistrocladus abbreviatus]